MSNKMFLILILTLVEAFPVDGQSTLGSCEASGLNLVDEMQSSILEEIRRIMKEELLALHLSNMISRDSYEGLQLKDSITQDLLDLRLNNISQTLQSFSSRLEELDRNVKSGRESCEGLQLKDSITQVEDLLDLRLNNITQTLQSFNNQLEILSENIEIGTELSEDLRLQLQNVSKLYEEQCRYIQSFKRKLEEADKVSLSQSTTSTPTQGGRGEVTVARDCQGIRTVGQNLSGVYQVNVSGSGRMSRKLSVYCDMNSSNVGWLVFQRRQDGSENLERTWIEYKNGFGNLTGEFWLGNDALHLLTSNRNNRLRIELEDFEGAKRYAEYATFSVGSASENYRLNISGYSGNAGDSLEYHNGKMFSTLDADNDPDSGRHCAQQFHGAWWYNSCHYSNLNGLYQRDSRAPKEDGIIWRDFRGLHYSLKKVVMKIAP